MKQTKLNRRAFLRGTSGLMLPLPFLEIMTVPSHALAATNPVHFGLFFAGQSIGADDDGRNFILPKTMGSGFEQTVGLKPLFSRGVNSYVSVVSDLKIPVGFTVAGGRRHEPSAPDSDIRKSFHKTGHLPALCGSHLDRTTEGGDQIIANTIGAQNTFKSLHFCGQFTEALPWATQLTYKKVGTSYQPITPQFSPQAAFNSLFSNFSIGSTDPSAQAIRQRRVSILDQVLLDRNRFAKVLGAKDKQRIEQHFDEIRSLEQRVAAGPAVATSSCSIPTGNFIKPIQTNPNFNNETEINRLFMDLIYMAFACNLTSVATHVFTAAQCFLAAKYIHPELSGFPYEVHTLGHSGTSDWIRLPPGTFVNSHIPFATNTLATSSSYGMSLVHQWQVDFFAYLMQKMKATPEGSGNMLDNSALVMLFEGGHSSPNEENDRPGSHTTENMLMLVAGKAGGLKPKGFMSAGFAHPAQVTLAAMKAVGHTGTTLGEISGPLMSLF